MKNAQSVMMDRIAAIENCVLGGLVLDDRGNWVPIADKKSSEEDFLVHLEAGRVLHNGRWVTFEDAGKPAGLSASEAPNPGEETAVHAPAVGHSTAVAQGPDDNYPPETKSIQMQPELPEANDPDSGDVSSYTMETGLFVIDRSVETVPQPQQSEPETRPVMPVQSGEVAADVATKGMGMRVFVPASIPTWEKEESRQKKRTIVIGGIVIAAVGIAALALIVSQVLL